MIRIILPNQLFDAEYSENCYLLEHPKYFKRFKFHKKKLLLHRASMKAYEQRKSIESYIGFEGDMEKPFRKNDKVKVFRPEDRQVREWLQQAAKKHDTDLDIQQSPMFLTSMDWNQSYFRENRFFQLDYYKQQRKRRGILVNQDGKPEGGKWSFDPENREKMPEDEEQPEIPRFNSDYVEDARDYVEENFSEKPGYDRGLFLACNPSTG